MNTRLRTIFSTYLVALLLSACGMRVINGSGEVITESRLVSDFTTVNFSGFGELTLVQGEDEGLTIETDDNLLPYIKTTVSRGTLTIGLDEGVMTSLLRPTQSIRYNLAVKTLTALELSGAGTVQGEQLTTNSLRLAESGAGEITIAQLAADEVAVEMSGAGSVDLAGQVTRQTVEMSGLGNYQAGDLESQTTEITLSGAGEATVWVSEQLDAELSGAGTINYYGAPPISTETSGVGRVESLGDK